MKKKSIENCYTIKFRKQYTPLFLMLFILNILHGQAQIHESSFVQVPPDNQIKTKGELGTQPGVFARFIPVTKETKFIVSQYSSPNESEKDEILLKIKAAKTAAKKNAMPATSDESTNRRALTLSVGNNFAGNYGFACPSDNTMAISANGNIVSGENSNFYYYSENGNLLGYTTMSNLFSGVTSVSNLCDPKVVYDSYANRFILFAQVCDGVPANSRLLLAFSKTSNPLDGFYTYWFTGNPLNDNSWFDYPKMAVYTNEILVTGNLYYGSGGNNQSVIYQINKNACYAGTATSFQYWYRLPNSPFTILPLAYGQEGTVGPPYNLVNTHSTFSGNTLDFYQISGEITASNETINHWSVNVSPYSAPGDALQLNGSNAIDVGDCRTMDGFFLNGYAHFVHIYDENNWSGIRYNRLRISDLTNQIYNIQNAGTYDYAYPSICSYGTSATDKSVLINFFSSGPSIYPEMRVKEVDDALQSNSSIQVKNGLSAVSSCYDQKRVASRWGDYSGAWRKPFSNPPVAWVSGSYGNFFGSWSTWISEIKRNGASSGTEGPKKSSNTSVFPNPAAGSFSVSFTAPETGSYSVKIFTADGKEADAFRLNDLTMGNHSVKYLKKLPSGTYMVCIYGNHDKKISNEKIVVAD